MGRVSTRKSGVGGAENCFGADGCRGRWALVGMGAGAVCGLWVWEGRPELRFAALGGGDSVRQPKHSRVGREGRLETLCRWDKRAGGTPP